MLHKVAPKLDVVYLQSFDWWAKVDKSAGENECWSWTQSTGSHGYGQTWDGISVRLAHRVAWTLTYGEIPTHLTVDHVCHVRMCCNPRHLRLLPNVENASDNGFATRTHCPRGHEYAGDNLYIDRTGGRRCRACARRRARRRAAEAKP